MMSSENPSVQETTNSQLIVCQYCPSKILRPGFATLTEIELRLPVMRAKSKSEGEAGEWESETLREFWAVSDMYQFENIGFSRDVENMKYLVCADCEMGPIGSHDKNTKISYISPSRVRYISTSTSASTPQQ